MVRVVESTYWLSVAAIAKQDLDEKPEKKNDPTTLALAEVWDKLQSDWEDLLNQKRIDMQIERSIIQGTNINQKNRRDYLSKQQTIFTPYNQALGQILHLSEDDPKFQTQTRLLVIRARAQIKALVKAEAATIKPPLAKATLDDL